jgi:hypothetical protein
MTVRTRRRLFVSLLVLALTLPAESILLKAVTVPNVKDAAKQYVSSLSTRQLQAAASTIQSFPYAYRRQIMAALTPDARVKVWQNHIANYVATHPTLDPTASQLLGVIASQLTPELLSTPTGAEKQNLGALASQVSQIVGTDDAAYLFLQLGPKDLAPTVSEPLTEHLANYLRQGFELLADASGDCDCSTQYGCGEGKHCEGNSACNVDTSWPMCGWFWDESCDGTCYFGLPS